MHDYDESHKQIEDVINAKIESGQYDILINNLKPSVQNANVRYAYSTPTHPMDDIRDETAIMHNIEGENNNDFRLTDYNAVGPTDSEITVIRVKREGSQYRTQVNNNWDMQDDRAIPGDGTHLGESPSLVNLVTLVVPSKPTVKADKQEDAQHEYMVPLSSWEPIAAVNNHQVGEKAETPKRHSGQSTDSSRHRSFMEILKCLIFRKKTQADDNNN